MGKEIDVEATEIFRELDEIGKAQPNRLDSTNAERVRWFMRRAKEKGYSNERIHRLTNRRWSINTIKQWTKNVGVTDSTAMERIDEMFRDAIQSDASMKDVREYVEHKKTLQKHRLTHDDELEFMAYLRQSPEELATMIVLFGRSKQEKLGIADLLEARGNLVELRQLDYSEKIFTDLKLAAKGFDPQSLLKAIIPYKNLQTVETELKKKSDGMQIEGKKLEALKRETGKLEALEAQIKQYIEKHAQLTSQGFTEQIFDLLLNVAENYGGVENVVKALDVYQKLQQLLSEVASLEQKCQDSESRLKMLNSEYADLQTVIAMRFPPKEGQDEHSIHITIG